MKKFKILTVILCIVMFGNLFFACNTNKDGDGDGGDKTPVETLDTTTRNIFVSNDAQDDADGSKEKPFGSIEAARDFVRTIKAQEERSITVYLRGGTYEQNKTLVFDDTDSAMEGKTITYTNYPNEKAVISGGKTVTGWRFADGKYYATVGSDLAIRNFYIDGVRKQRAGITPSGISKSSNGYSIATTGALSGIKNFSELKELEIVSTNQWKMFRVKADKVAGDTLLINSTQLANGMAQDPYGLLSNKSTIVRVENAYELLTQKGEWYYSKQQGKIYYIPLDNEKMSGKETVVGVTQKLLSIEGGLNGKVSNLKFSGLTFSYDSWSGVDTMGYIDCQSGVIQSGSSWFDMYKTPAGVTLSKSEHIVFERNTFTHMGINALAVTNGSKNITIKNNIFSDISAGAVSIADIRGGDPRMPDVDGVLYDHHPTDETSIVEHITVQNNYIANIGVEYWGNAAIFVGYARNISILNNTLHNLPYSGISMGWGWGYPDDANQSICENNLIKGNKIYNFMNKLIDGGGIYTLGEQPNSKIAENFVSTQNNDYAYIYLDNGSAGFTVEKNVISSEYNGKVGYCLNWILVSTFIPDPPSLLAHDNVVKNNWYSSGLTIFRLSSWTPELKNTQTNNLSISDKAWTQEAKDVMAAAGSTIVL